jgi:hypothetical protein
VSADLGSNKDAAVAAAGLVGLTVGVLSKNFKLAAAGAVALGWFGMLWWQRVLDVYYPASANP